MTLAVVLLLLGAVALVGSWVAMFQWGWWKCGKKLAEYAAEHQQAAMDALARPPPRGSKLLRRMSDPSAWESASVPEAGRTGDPGDS